MGGSVVFLLAWGTLVGLDLVTGPQTMIARPLVAGTVAGWILGDTAAGFAVGSLLELFALEIMPFGAARYADYGLGAVAAAAVAAGTPDVLGVGLGVGLATVIALVGQHSTQTVRRRNSADAARLEARLDLGDAEAVSGIHLRCLGRDAFRGFLVAALGLSLAALVRRYSVIPISAAVGATLGASGVAFGTGFVSAVRYGRASRYGVALFVVGVIGGTAWITLA